MVYMYIYICIYHGCVLSSESTCYIMAVEYLGRHVNKVFQSISLCAANANVDRDDFIGSDIRRLNGRSL